MVGYQASALDSEVRLREGGVVEKEHHLASLIVNYWAARKGVNRESLESEVALLAKLIRDRFGKPLLPSPAETVAVSLDLPKTSALFFDRVWWMPGVDNSPPEDMIVYGATDQEVWPFVVTSGLRPPDWDWELIQEVFGKEGPIAELWAQSVPPASKIAEILLHVHGIAVVPVYSSDEACSREYSVGSTEAIVGAIQNLRIVDESRLDWDQVVQFRQDPRATTKLRRLRHWLDLEFVGKPISYISDSIAVRLDDYEWALQKHGIETAIGTLESLLDKRFLSTAAAAAAGLAMAGGEFWAAVGAAGLLAGKVALSVGTRLLDLAEQRRGNHSEVAFVHEMKTMNG